MKVIENTHERLVLEHRPVKPYVGFAVGVLFVAAALLGLIFDRTIASAVFLLACSLLLLIPFFLFKIERTRLMLDRTKSQLHFQRKTLRGWVSEVHDLTDLHCAEIEKQTDRSGTLYRPVVSFKAATSKDQIALVEMFSSARQPQFAVDTVNKWLDLSRQMFRQVS